MREKIQNVLAITPHREDWSCLRAMLNRNQWKVNTVFSNDEAGAFLDSRRPSLVLCDRDLPDGSWKEILQMLQSLPAPPPLIVTSQHADERLWAEVLNLGGYDVLAKPFDPMEVSRVTAMALRHAASQTSAAVANA